MRSLGLFLLMVAALTAIGFGARDSGLGAAISLSPYDCGNGRVAYPFSGVSLLQFVVAFPLSVLLGRKVFFRGDYVKLIGKGVSIGFHAGGIALFLILAALFTGLLQYFDNPCTDFHLDASLPGGRIIFIAVICSVIGVLFSDLLRYRVRPSRNP
jgi:hypothetical protein